MFIPMIDTVVFNIDILGYAEWIAQIKPALQNAKDKAYEQQRNKYKHNSYLKIGGKTFQMWPNGRIDKAFILKNAFFDIYISAHRSKKEEVLPISVRVSQRYLWEHGFEKSILEITKWLEFLSAEICNLIIGEVHLCCHTDQIQFDKFTRDDFATVSKTYRQITSNLSLETHEFGSRKSPESPFIRIYNKSAEIKATNKTWFQKIWTKKGWNGHNVWNIEFELKRAFLKEWHINNHDELLVYIKALWRSLTSDKLELRDRVHTEKKNDEVHPTWQHIQKVFDVRPGVLELTKKEVQYAQLESLMPQLSGLSTTYFITKYPQLDFTNLERNQIKNLMCNLIDDIVTHIESNELEKAKKVTARKTDVSDESINLKGHLNKKRNELFIKRGLNLPEVSS